MTLEEVRAGIDAVDTQMKPLFLKRMECGKHVAEVKAQTGGDVFVLERELEIIEKRATDVDPEESAKTKKRLEEQGFGEDMLTIKLQNFCTIDEIAKEAGGFDFILADLGVSSMQIDNPKRGFSFRADGPLDLRLNQEKGISAAERLDTISREELAGMLYENSDEPYCEELAKAITDEIRKGNRIDTLSLIHI